MGKVLQTIDCNESCRIIAVPSIVKDTSSVRINGQLIKYYIREVHFDLASQSFALGKILGQTFVIT